MDVAIHEIGKANAHILENVAEDVFDHAISPEPLATFLGAPNHMMVVAIAGNLVVGQIRAVVHAQPDKGLELYIDNLGVAPEFRRQGIARRLVGEIIRLGKARGCAEIWVATEPDNDPAKALYRSLGLRMQPTVMFEGKL